MAGRSLLEEQVLVKLALNLHSTLAMGRIGRYRANVMTKMQAGSLSELVRMALVVGGLPTG